MDINLLKLRYFYEVARLGSISRGAQSLRISQPSVTKMVRELEEQLEVKLFDRKTRGVSLTEAGVRAYSHASRIFAEVAELGHSMKKDEKIGGKWSIALSDTLAIYTIPSVIAKMQRDHPTLKTEIIVGTSTDVKRELLLDQADCGLFFTPLSQDEPFDAQKIFEAEFWLVVSPKILNGRTVKTLSLEQLKRLKLARLESRHSEYRASTVASLHSQKLGLTGAPKIQVNSHEVKKQLVIEGAGYSILTALTVEKEVRSGALIRVSTPVRLVSPVYFVVKKGRTWTPTIRAFVRELSAHLAAKG